MNAMRERSRSVWMEIDPAPGATPLAEGFQADVAIVGSGIAGLSIAHELARRGRSVAVFDRGPIAGGMTSRTTAHLGAICDDSLSGLISMRGEDVARAFQASQAAAIDRIEAIQRELGAACEFRRLDAYLILDAASDESVIDDEFEAARRLGVSVERGRGLTLPTMEARPWLKFPRQATFHPMKYLRALVQDIQARGGRLFPHTPVESVSENGRSAQLTLQGGRIVPASAVVVATNSPIHDMFALHTKQAPYRTYAMTFEMDRGALADALYWDTADPYHYVRLTEGEDGRDLLIVGGEDHKTGEADDAPRRFEALEGWIRTLAPQLGRERHRWSGQVMETLDYAAFIGRESGSERIFVATGDSGQGMTHGVAASLIIPDLIEGRRNVFAEVYDPGRKPVQAAATYVAENATMLSGMARHLAPADIGSADLLAPGQGAILREGLKKIAAYRDEAGVLYRRSAACSHLGCHLSWNSFEQCWDCPCHGSHFAPDGSVLNAPAIGPLAEIDEEQSVDQAP